MPLHDHDMEPTMTNITKQLPASAYAAADGNTYRSSALTRGPWHPDHQHAGPM